MLWGFDSVYRWLIDAFLWLWGFLGFILDKLDVDGW